MSSLVLCVHSTTTQWTSLRGRKSKLRVRKEEVCSNLSVISDQCRTLPSTWLFSKRLCGRKLSKEEACGMSVTGALRKAVKLSVVTNMKQLFSQKRARHSNQTGLAKRRKEESKHRGLTDMCNSTAKQAQKELL